MADKRVNKVVLAYSGGLDTSIILKWLQTTYGCEVVTFTADLGQGEELEPARRRRSCSASSRRTSSSRICATSSCATTSSRCSAPTPSTRASTSSAPRSPGRSSPRSRSRSPSRSAPTPSPTARPARATTRSASSSAYYALKPDVTVIAPWREWDLTLPHEAHRVRRSSTRSRSPRTSAARRRSRSTPTSCTPPRRARCWRIPRRRCPDYVYSRTNDPESAPDKPTIITIDFEKGDPVAIDGKQARPGGPAGEAQRARPPQRHRPPRPGREPLRRHEEPRHVRDAGRHHPGRSPIAASNRSPSTAARPISRTS